MSAFPADFLIYLDGHGNAGAEFVCNSVQRGLSERKHVRRRRMADHIVKLNAEKILRIRFINALNAADVGVYFLIGGTLSADFAEESLYAERKIPDRAFDVFLNVSERHVGTVHLFVPGVRACIEFRPDFTFFRSEGFQSFAHIVAVEHCRVRDERELQVMFRVALLNFAQTSADRSEE